MTAVDEDDVERAVGQARRQSHVRGAKIETEPVVVVPPLGEVGTDDLFLVGIGNDTEVFAAPRPEQRRGRAAPRLEGPAVAVDPVGQELVEIPRRPPHAASGSGVDLRRVGHERRDQGSTLGRSHGRSVGEIP